MATHAGIPRCFHIQGGHRRSLLAGPKSARISFDKHRTRATPQTSNDLPQDEDSVVIESVRNASTQRCVTWTHLGSNSFTLEFKNGAKLLVDPWLVGTLSFGDTSWLLESSKYLPDSVDSVVDGVDTILITQGLDDHCHVPTLKALPKGIPVVAQPDAAQTARELGFSNVKSIDHGDVVRFCSVFRVH